MDVPPSPSEEIRVLSDLFICSFQTAAAMSAFIRSVEAVSEIGPDLPSDNVSARKMAVELAEHMARRRLHNKGLFQELAEIRPSQFDIIKRAAGSLGFDLDPIQPRGGKDRSTIILDPEGSDFITLEVVSRVVGRSWMISLSRHRVAKYAARDMFAAIILNDDKTISKIMFDDEYWLCQGGRRFARDIIGKVIDPGLPVHIKRRQRDLVCLCRA